MGNRWIGNTFIYLIIFVAVIAVFFMLFSPGDDGEQSDLTSILALAKNGQISNIVVDGDRIVATSRQGNQQLVAAKEPGTSIFEILQAAEIDPVEQGIEVQVQRRGGLGNLFGDLFGRRRGSPVRRRRGNGHGSGRAHAERVLYVLHQPVQLQDGQPLDRFQDLFLGSHVTPSLGCLLSDSSSLSPEAISRIF